MRIAKKYRSLLTAACVLAAARRQTWVQARELKPYYLRLPQAERERLAREEERR